MPMDHWLAVPGFDGREVRLATGIGSSHIPDGTHIAPSGVTDVSVGSTVTSRAQSNAALPVPDAA